MPVLIPEPGDLRAFGDVELLTVKYLKTVGEVVAEVGTRVYTKLPKQPTFPLLAVNRIGGIPAIERHLDVARLQIDAWGTTKFEARAVAAVAQAALYQMTGIHDEGVVTAVADDLGFTWSPDPATNRDRYLFGVAVYVHPHPS